MAPDSGPCRGNGRYHFYGKGDNVRIRQSKAVSGRVAFMGRRRRVYYFVCDNAHAFKKACDDGTVSYRRMGGAGAIGDQRALWNRPVLSWLAVALAVVVGIAALISLICYVLYYNLGNTAGYIDGMIPLLMVALVMSGLSAALAI